MLALVLALSALPATGVEVVDDGARKRLVVMPLEASGAVDAQDAETLDGRLVRLLSRRASLEVIDPRDIQRYVDLQSERAAAGLKCDDEGCLAEVADALGAERILYGRVGKLGQQFSLQLSLFDASTARSVARAERSSLLIEVLGGSAMEEAVAELLGESDGAGSSTTPNLPREVRPGAHALFWTGAVIGGVGAAAALGLGATAVVLDGQLADTTGQVSAADKTFARDTGWVFALGAGMGAALAVTGGMLALVGATE